FITIQFSGEIKVATTRPELLGACRAIFVHPTDARYKKLIGKKVKVPLYNHEVPIISDESADKEKGTGALMICSYGDKFDVEDIKKHKLMPKIIFTNDGKLKDERYAGLKIKEARKKIEEDLEKENFIKEKKLIHHIVNTHDKCGTEIEFLPTQQWFIKILDKKNKFIAEGKKIHWHPNHMQKRYENWINGLEWDWSVSRERHFGIPIPCWHCKACKKIICADEKELPVDPMQIKKKCSECKTPAQPEEKVLDTWATSSLTPFISNNLINNSLKLPFSLRPQAHDLIRTWAFYTIVRSLYLENKIPWDNIMISGFITLGGEKMSKSKGNVIAPQTIIQQYGADALRFWAAGSKLGEDLDYQEKDVVTGKKLLNKLWNATNFVFLNMPKIAPKKPKKLETIDELFLIKLNQLIEETTKSFENYEYAKAKQDVEKFFWSFCDNYLEIIKKRMYNEIGGKKESAQYVVYQTLLTLLKLFAPFIPFITEHIYQQYFRKIENKKSIHLSSWPKNEQKYSESKTDELDNFLQFLVKIRQEKSTHKKPMNAEIIVHLPKKECNEIKKLQQDLKDVANAKEIKEGKEFKIEFI
ncbi:MAG: class I tRNA ligase family protein, partial [Nanoarchaeota archaeon]